MLLAGKIWFKCHTNDQCQTTLNILNIIQYVSAVKYEVATVGYLRTQNYLIHLKVFSLTCLSVELLLINELTYFDVFLG